MRAHDIPYVATCSISEPLDIYEKFQKAKSIEGCKYIHILAPCAPGWGYPSEDTIEIARLAVKTGSWILFEVEKGENYHLWIVKKFNGFWIAYHPLEDNRIAEKETLEIIKRIKHEMVELIF